MAKITSLVGLVLLLGGCGCRYLGHVSLGQAGLLVHRQPVEKVVEDSRLTKEETGKIHLILDVGDFAIRDLGLTGRSYSTFVRVEEPYVSYNLSAAYQDALKPYTWWFPVVGRLPYKGFFRKDYALSEERRLSSKGYDTYLRGVCAFSTLGYFNDPIVSCMLRYENPDLVETIIHELLHQTVWVKGSVSFNESLANFVGEKGTLIYLASRYGNDSDEYQYYQDLLEDTRLLEDYLAGVVERVERLYEQPISREEKLAQRDVFFLKAATDYAEVVTGMKTDRYSDFFTRRRINNAVLLSFRRYHVDTAYFEESLKETGGDLRQLIATFKTFRPGQIPEAFRDR